jgi:signal recognition particle subunit SEC65
LVHFKLGDYFREGSHKTAISLPELVRQTNSFSTKNRPGCQPTLMGSKPKQLFLAYNVKCTLKDSDPNGHDVKIQFDISQVKDEMTAKNLDVAVNCSCPAFLYWGGQWNSHTRDALTGDPRPLLTAPTEQLDKRDGFVICKHIKAVSERILPSVQFNIVKILRQRDIDRHQEEERVHPKELDDREQAKKVRRDEEAQRMRDRMQKKKQKDRKDQTVRKRLEEGIKNRDVVKRDMPATPEERERVPVLAPEKVPAPKAPPAPTPAAPKPVPVAQKMPPPPKATEMMDLDAELGLEPALPPNMKKPESQKMPRVRKEDHDTLDELLKQVQEKEDDVVQPTSNPGKRR